MGPQGLVPLLTTKAFFEFLLVQRAHPTWLGNSMVSSRAL